MAGTIREVAKKAGVSPATVSRYFSGSKIVSTNLARKIEAAATQAGYVHEKRNNRDVGVIAVVIPHLRFAFFGEVLKEILEQVPKYRYRVVFIPTVNGSDDYKKFFKEMNIDGVVYLDEDIDKDILNYISSKNIKTVMCGGAALDSRSEMVHINDMAAAYEGTRYLLKLGHEKLLFLSDYGKCISSGFQRMTGCKRALEEFEIPFDETMVYYGMVTYDMGYRLTIQALEEKRDFTAIFAFSDEMAIGAISALHDRDLKVPEDISVLGFDDLSIAERMIPRLTTIRQPLKQFVAKTLDAFLETGNKNQNMEITLPYEIIKRESCKERGKGNA